MPTTVTTVASARPTANLSRARGRADEDLALLLPIVGELRDAGLSQRAIADRLLGRA